MNRREDKTRSEDDAIAVTAGDWLGRRDRGLSAEEQDAFLQWLRSDPRHRTVFARLDRTWSALDSLAAWQPADGAEPNPDLLAPAPSAARHGAPRRRALSTLVCAGLAAALAFVLLKSPADTEGPPPPAPGMRVLPKPDSRTFADGSIADIRHGANLEVSFSPEERRVRLREGEVHLSVAKDAARPFVVEAGAVRVRAVGTAFNVRLERDDLEVLVTEGSVSVEVPEAAPVPVSGGERARIESRGRTVVTREKPEAIARDLAWRDERLEFEGLPLSVVVAEFNLRNVRQLAIGDEEAGRVKVAGTFRSSEPEAFVRLLEAGFGISVERRAAGAWVLRCAAAKK